MPVPGQKLQLYKNRNRCAILSTMEVLWVWYELALCMFSQSPTELQQCPHWLAKTRTLRRHSGDMRCSHIRTTQLLDTVGDIIEQWLSTCGSRPLWGSNNPFTGVP